MSKYDFTGPHMSVFSSDREGTQSRNDVILTTLLDDVITSHRRLYVVILTLCGEACVNYDTDFKAGFMMVGFFCIYLMTCK